MSIIKNAVIFTDRDPALRADIRVSEEKITQIRQTICPAEGEQVYDLSGYTVYPGFVSAHVHVADVTDEGLREFVRNGCTSMRDMGIMIPGDCADKVRQLKENLNDPELPRVVTCGKFICTPTSYGSLHPSGARVGAESTSPKEVKEWVEYFAHLGCEGVKTGLDNGAMLGQQCDLPEDWFFEALFEAARENGMWVSAHISTSENLARLLTYGDSEIAHVPVDEMPDSLIKEIKDRDLCVCTTLTAYEMLGNMVNIPFVEAAERNVKILYDAGVRLAVGNDMIADNGVFEHGIPIRELQLLYEAGLPINEIIKDATSEAARTCWLDKITGSIQEGKSADLIAVRKEPDAGFDCFRDIPFVMNRGSVVADMTDL